MQSMIPTTAGGSAGNTAASRSKGNEVTVIASSVSPTEKDGKKTENSFSKSTGFSSQPSTKEGSEAIADTSPEAAGNEAIVAYANHALPHTLGQAPLTGEPGQVKFPAGLGDGAASHGAHIAQTLGQALNGTSPQALGQALNKVSATTATEKLNELTTAALSQQHSASSPQVTSSGQTGTGTISTAQQLADDSSLATAFTCKLNEVLASKSEQNGISAFNGPASDLNHPAISQSQSPSQASPTRAVWANVQMDASQGKWGEQMLQVLQDRVTLQATQNLQEARIRLDPPDLGKLDLVVRVDGERLNVQINANHAAVRDALVQVSERLRAELQQQQFVHVDVNVGTGDQGQASYSQAQQDESYQPVILGANDNLDDNLDTTSEHWLSTTA